ncbi:MAG: hypothetical protein ACLTG4_08280 [Oscillospiraceae bacterium]
MKYRNWQIPYTAPQPPEALLRAGYSPLLAVLLALRGYADPGQARAFLSGGDQSVFDPMLLQDMDKAVARIRAAIERRENVAVFGDYDVDGITSTCVLTDYLPPRRARAPAHPRPHRGGLRPEHGRDHEPPARRRHHAHHHR